MKYWFIIDDETTRSREVYTLSLPGGSTREDAIDNATMIWGRMTRLEKKAVDQLYIGYAKPDGDDSDEREIIPDYNTMTDIVDLLPRLRAYDSGEDYYILRDLSGYGSADPVCVTRERAEELAREWDEEDPDTIWIKASLDDVARYGIEE